MGQAAFWFPVSRPRAAAEEMEDIDLSVCPIDKETPHLSFLSPAVPGLGTVPFSFAPSLISAERLSLPGHHKPLGRTRSEPLPQNPKAIQQQLVYQQHHAQFLERLKQQTHLGKVSTEQLHGVQEAVGEGCWQDAGSQPFLQGSN